MRITGGNEDATGTFTVDAKGTITAVALDSRGAGFLADVPPKHVAVLYRGTSVGQTGTVTSVHVEDGGEGFVNGLVRITGGTATALGVLYTRAGAIQEVRLTDHGAGFHEQVPATAIELMHGALNTTQTSSITSVTIGGAQTTAYTDGSATVTCTGGCTGSGFAASCNTRGGSVIHLVITRPGAGYSAANPPTIACPSGAGQTFAPVIASGAVLSARVAVGARLYPIRAGGAARVVPSARLPPPPPLPPVQSGHVSSISPY